MLAVCLVCGMTACGEPSTKSDTKSTKKTTTESTDKSDKKKDKKSDKKATSKVATVTIEGNKYDLSEDFQEVVGDMAKDGFVVVNMWNGAMLFDEDGKSFTAESYDKDAPRIQAINRRTDSVPALMELEDELGKLVYKQYWITSELSEFEAELGFSGETKNSDMDDLEIFEELSPVLEMSSDGYVAVFVDGEAVDFDEYEDLYEEWEEELDASGHVSAKEKFLPDLHYAQLGSRFLVMPVMKMGEDSKQIKDSLSRKGMDLEEEMLYAFAMQDACKKLEEGKAKSVITIKVEITDDEDYVRMQYTEYYFDKDWDDKKFSKND